MVRPGSAPSVELLRAGATGAARCGTVALRRAAASTLGAGGLDGKNVELAGHEDYAFQADAFGAVEFGAADVGAERAVAGGLGPGEDAVGVAFVFRDVGFDPLDHGETSLAGSSQLAPGWRCMLTTTMPFLVAQRPMLS